MSSYQEYRDRFVKLPLTEEGAEEARRILRFMEAEQLDWAKMLTEPQVVVWIQSNRQAILKSMKVDDD